MFHELPMFDKVVIVSSDVNCLQSIAVRVVLVERVLNLMEQVLEVVVCY